MVKAASLLLIGLERRWPRYKYAKISCLLALVIVDSATENAIMNIRIIATLTPLETWRKYKRITGMMRRNAEMMAVSVLTMALVRLLE